jgi:hypothetical protein
MLNAMEQLMRLHPGSRFGRLERHHSDLEAFEELESRHLCPRHEYEADRSEPTRMIGEAAAAAAMLVVFIGVLTVIARFAADAPGTEQEPVVAVYDARESR